jgi:flagellar hook assembly protein FlgD
VSVATVPDGTVATLTFERGKTPATGSEVQAEAEVNERSSQTISPVTLVETPDEVALEPNYPNPVHRATKIVYRLPETARVQVSVYNTLGRRVATLTDRRRQAGTHRIAWKPGRSLPSGVYFYRLETLDQSITRRMLVAR